MQIDLHIHTAIGSPCSRIELDELIQQAIRLNLDAICITDHDTKRAVKDAKRVGEKYDFLVLEGIEVRCIEGDVLVFGYNGDLTGGISIQDLIIEIKKEDGIIIPVHPFRWGVPSIGDLIYELDGIEVIEVLNGNVSDKTNKKAEEAAKRLNLKRVGGSDAHIIENVGKYITCFNTKISNEIELIKALKQNEYYPKKLF